ncbi:MAG: DUF4292 domain-containing protein [Balneolaceae bacterium]
MSVFLLAGCSPSGSVLSIDDMDRSAISADSLVSIIPDYSRDLETLSGRGRAMISQPGGSDRVTLQFYSDRNTSLLTVRNSVGIEGAQILVDSDSLLIYNKVDNYAEKASLRQSNLSSVGSIASVNMLDLFNFTVSAPDIRSIYENDRNYGVQLQSGATLSLAKPEGLILEVNQPPDAEETAYNRIIYESYAEIQGFYLPRKITIFSSDGKSRATFLVQQLEANESLPPLTIQLPEDIPVYRP